MIRIAPLDEGNSARAFELVTREFAIRSQPHRALNIELAEYRAHLAPTYQHMVEQGHSYIALDERQNLLGCIVAADYCVTAPATGHQNGSTVIKMKPLMVLLEQLDRAYREHRSLVPGQTMLIDMAVVSPGATGQGIYRRMREAAHEHARLRGFAYVAGELSSAATQHVCVNLFQHQVVARIRFADFLYNGEYPFATLLDPPDILLVEGELNGSAQAHSTRPALD